MNKEEIDKWLNEEYGCSYTRLEELHDFYFEKYCDLRDRINKAIEYIENKNNGVCIVNGEEKDAYTFLLDFKKSREFVWQLLEILKGDR